MRVLLFGVHVKVPVFGNLRMITARNPMSILKKAPFSGNPAAGPTTELRLDLARTDKRRCFLRLQRPHPNVRHFGFFLVWGRYLVQPPDPSGKHVGHRRLINSQIRFQSSPGIAEVCGTRCVKLALDCPRPLWRGPEPYFVLWSTVLGHPRGGVRGILKASWRSRASYSHRTPSKKRP